MCIKDTFNEFLRFTVIIIFIFLFTLFLFVIDILKFFLQIFNINLGTYQKDTHADTDNEEVTDVTSEDTDDEEATENEEDTEENIKDMIDLIKSNMDEMNKNPMFDEKFKSFIKMGIDLYTYKEDITFENMNEMIPKLKLIYETFYLHIDSEILFLRFVSISLIICVKMLTICINNLSFNVYEHDEESNKKIFDISKKIQKIISKTYHEDENKNTFIKIYKIKTIIDLHQLDKIDLFVDFDKIRTK